ncbi:Uncharacterised protein (plasmid) [Tsukamurella tyrosinosolvens]|uniref:Uncharacterized protein n=1 Tax=Tsukamurella tyrosinosolvens TaxID=57704 RepID=A0A1H4UUW3_TSUTY|nr:hypothetical protein [Tsukamurella tyrosinosolvens]KXO98394.1 hypothetical protein AXK58_25310 [Tsukamurella tyrosinosolvens]SEC72589.1 hypothetical protein SAMN04489793_3049 [Tsukamurella tyrosinosolvens]VEH90863.1 Uncharacterised protein [Tsukamurella tyrosinosolvens]
MTDQPIPRSEAHRAPARVQEDQPDELSAETLGTWRVGHADGTETVWVLHHNRTELLIGDQLRGIERVHAYPAAGKLARVTRCGENEVVTTAVTSIRRWRREEGSGRAGAQPL